jgi:hypothetical protein
MIISLGGDLSLFMLRNIYFIKLQSLIRYGIIVWGGNIERVNVQKGYFIKLKGWKKASLVGQFL